MYLYHYFEKAKGPFLSIMDLSYDQAFKELSYIQEKNKNLVNPRKKWFLSTRRELEYKVRNLAIEKGSKPVRLSPFYMTLGKCDEMSTWFEVPAVIKIHISEFNLDELSFTYGDMFPVFNPDLNDGKEYRENVYNFEEIINIIDKYGYPECIPHNLRDGIHPVDAPINHFLKYVEAHIWSDDVVSRYRDEWLATNSTV